MQQRERCNFASNQLHCWNPALHKNRWSWWWWNSHNIQRIKCYKIYSHQEKTLLMRIVFWIGLVTVLLLKYTSPGFELCRKGNMEIGKLVRLHTVTMFSNNTEYISDWDWITNTLVEPTSKSFPDISVSRWVTSDSQDMFVLLLGNFWKF